MAELNKIPFLHSFTYMRTAPHIVLYLQLMLFRLTLLYRYVKALVFLNIPVSITVCS